MRINVSIPLALSRLAIYWLISVFTVCLILLPWSIIAWMRFYQILVQNPIVSHHLTFDYVFKNRGPFAVANSHDFIQSLVRIYEKSQSLQADPSLRHNSLSNFEITLRYKYTDLGGKDCQDPLVSLRFSILDDSLLNNKLRPWEISPRLLDEKSKHTKLWPITDNLPGITRFDQTTNVLRSNAIEWPLHRSTVNASDAISVAENTELRGKKRSSSLLSFWPSFLSKHVSANLQTVNGSRRGIYHSRTAWLLKDSTIELVPSWVMKYVLPPFLVGLFRFGKFHDFNLVDVSFPAEKLPMFSSQALQGILEDSKHIKLIVEFANPSIFITSADLDFTVKFKGFRHYLYHYKAASFILGVSAFWAISSVICVILSYGMFLWIKSKKSSQVKQLGKRPTTLITSVSTSIEDALDGGKGSG